MASFPRIEDLRRRVEKDPASIAFAQLAEEYRRAGEYAEAIRVARAGLVLHPGYLSARVTLGRALLAVGQLEEAQTELDTVLKSAAENFAAIRALAEIHQRRRDTRHASATSVESKPEAPPEPSVDALPRTPVEGAPLASDRPQDRDSIEPPPSTSPIAASAPPDPTPIERATVEEESWESEEDSWVSVPLMPLPSEPVDPTLHVLEQWLEVLTSERAGRRL